MPLSNSILARLQNQHETIAELTGGFSDLQLKKRINPDKWSIFENIAHLCAYQPAFAKRIEKIIAEESPSFERYVAENDSYFNECLRLSLEEMIAKIGSDRSTIITELNKLRDDQLMRTGRHPKYGSLSLYQWTDFFLLHEAHHLWTIMQLAFSLS
jgi:hypothetical protein